MEIALLILNGIGTIIIGFVVLLVLLALFGALIAVRAYLVVKTKLAETDASERERRATIAARRS